MSKKTDRSAPLDFNAVLPTLGYASEPISVLQFQEAHQQVLDEENDLFFFEIPADSAQILNDLNVEPLIIKTPHDCIEDAIRQEIVVSEERERKMDLQDRFQNAIYTSMTLQENTPSPAAAASSSSAAPSLSFNEEILHVSVHEIARLILDTYQTQEERIDAIEEASKAAINAVLASLHSNNTSLAFFINEYVTSPFKQAIEEAKKAISPKKKGRPKGKKNSKSRKKSKTSSVHSDDSEGDEEKEESEAVPLVAEPEAPEPAPFVSKSFSYTSTIPIISCPFLSSIDPTLQVSPTFSLRSLRNQNQQENSAVETFKTKVAAGKRYPSKNLRESIDYDAIPTLAAVNERMVSNLSSSTDQGRAENSKSISKSELYVNHLPAVSAANAVHASLVSAAQGDAQAISVATATTASASSSSAAPAEPSSSSAQSSIVPAAAAAAAVAAVMEVVPAGEVLLHVQIWHPERRQRVQEFVVLGNSKLSSLRDKIYCLNDYAAPPEVTTKSAMFHIERSFYNDMRDPDAEDYSETIAEFVASCAASDPQSLSSHVIGNGSASSSSSSSSALDAVDAPFTVTQMEDCRFNELTIRLGHPYLYQHQGDCRHYMYFSEMRIFDPAIDEQRAAAYPILVHQAKMYRRKCRVCDLFPARWVTHNDEMTCETPFFTCDHCFRSMHYSVDGEQLLYEGFKAFRYHHE